MPDPKGLTDAALADFRYALREFLAFSELRVAEHGLTPQQHQALLAIRGAGRLAITVGYIAERLVIKPHSASGLVKRLEASGYLLRSSSAADGRQAVLELTPKGLKLLEHLSSVHREEIVRLRPLLKTLLDTFV